MLVAVSSSHPPPPCPSQQSSTRANEAPPPNVPRAASSSNSTDRIRTRDNFRSDASNASTSLRISRSLRRAREPRRRRRRELVRPGQVVPDDVDLGRIRIQWRQSTMTCSRSTCWRRKKKLKKVRLCKLACRRAYLFSFLKAYRKMAIKLHPDKVSGRVLGPLNGQLNPCCRTGAIHKRRKT